MPQFKYEEITKKIIGAAMTVHSTLGNGFQEVIYQRAVEIEFRKCGLQFVREFSVELKAREIFEKAHFSQARNYLEAYNLEVGLLLNFGAVSLEYKRLENPKFNPNLISKKSI